MWDERPFVENKNTPTALDGVHMELGYFWFTSGLLLVCSCVGAEFRRDEFMAG